MKCDVQNNEVRVNFSVKDDAINALDQRYYIKIKT